MGDSIVSQLQDVADSIDRLSDEIRHEQHEEDRLDGLQKCIVVLSQSIDDLTSAIRYATNNLLDGRYHPELALSMAAAAVAESPQGERIASEEETAVGDDELEVDRSTEVEPEPSSEIPESVQQVVRGLVESLQNWGDQHANVAAYGAVTEMQWWENVGQQILYCNRRIQELRELAIENGADIQPLIDASGEIPETMLIDDVPDLASEPAFPPTTGNRQQQLFDAADVTDLQSAPIGTEFSMGLPSFDPQRPAAIESSSSTTRNRLAQLLSDKSLTANEKTSLVYEQTQSALEELDESLRAGKSQAVTEYLAVLSRFHNYSMRNIMLIAMQAPDATHVAGFNTWKKLGRTVKKGEKGIRIMAPISYRRRDASDDEGESQEGVEEESPKPVLAGFKVVSVFDIAQTDGKELPQPAEINGDPGECLEQLKALVSSERIDLSYEDIPSGALGLSKDGAIVIQQGLAKPEEFSVLAHELLHKGERRKNCSKTVKETEAEAVAFVVCEAIGLDQSTRSSDYIQLYQGNAETLAESLSAIQQTSQRIIEAIHCARPGFESTGTTLDR